MTLPSLPAVWPFAIGVNGAVLFQPACLQQIPDSGINADVPQQRSVLCFYTIPEANAKGMANVQLQQISAAWKSFARLLK